MYTHTALLSLMSGSFDSVLPLWMVATSALTSDPEERLGMAISITMMVGLISLTIGMLRLGFIVNFISRPVLAGFASAAACITSVSMLKVCELPHVVRTALTQCVVCA